MSALSIVFVTARFPLPLRSGDRARAFHQIRLLARRHRITLVTFLDPSPASADARRLIERMGAQVVAVPFSRFGAGVRIARALGSPLPLQTALFAAPALAAAVNRAIDATRPDVVHVQLARVWAAVSADVNVPCLVDLVDALSLNMRHRAARDRTPLRWAAALDARRLLRYEHEICTRASAVTVVTRADRDAIGDYPSLVVNANGVDLAQFPMAAAPRDPEEVVFSGNLGYFPNVDASAWFAREVMPRIWKDRPATRLTVAGARPHARVRALARDPRITVAADVPDMHACLARARVAVAPMLSGSGQLLKVLEAMATGTPVVATPRGLSGIEAIDGEHALVAERPDAFAAAVGRLLDDERRAVTMARAARQLVERQHTWEQSVAELERHYATIVATAPAARSA